MEDVTNNQADENNNEQVTAATEKKTFSQEEVNLIVQNRLQRERDKIAAEQGADIAKRETELQAREMRVTVREQLATNGMPGELAELIKAADEEELQRNIETLKKYLADDFKKADEKNKPGFFKIGANPPDGQKAGDPFRRVMGLD